MLNIPSKLVIILLNVHTYLDIMEFHALTEQKKLPLKKYLVSGMVQVRFSGVVFYVL